MGICRFSCYGPPLDTALLLVSWQIYEEASVVLFGQNKFILRVSRPDLLEDPLTKIRYLHVALDDSDETTGLRFDSPRGRIFIEAWEAICNRLAPLTRPRYLHFTFACAPKDTDTALYLADTLRLLCPLKSCASVFDSYLDHSFGPTVRELCLELSDMATPPEDPFQFSSLPRELRLQVLAHTDLVVRAKSVRNTAAALRFIDGVLASRNSCCDYCCAALQDCCCLTRPNAFSPTCRCVLDPTGLLRLSRKTYLDAHKVLYAHNTFRFIGPPAKTSESLSRLSSVALKLIRNVLLELSWEEHNIWSDNPEEFLDPWAELLKFIGGHFDLAVLSMTIHGNLWIYKVDEWDEAPSLEYFEDLREFYQDTLGHGAHCEEAESLLYLCTGQRALGDGTTS